MDTIVVAVQQGFNIGLTPSITLDGTAGSYILKDAHQHPMCIFKPLDEEPFAPLNPRGYTGKLGSLSFRPGVLSGESGYREVAAYLLDYHKFSSVPQTILVESLHKSYKSAGIPKIGSLQEFVYSQGCAEDFAPHKFDKDQVHKIGILDVRILNMDRNVANILVSKDMELIPIDHGLSIPDCFAICREDLCWMDWPHAK